MADDDLLKRFERESEKLKLIEKEEDAAYSKFCRLRSERENQQAEVNYLFGKVVHRHEHC